MSVTDESVAKELFEQIKAEHGKADVLLNCAGIGCGGALLTVPIEDFWHDVVCFPQTYMAIHLLVFQC